MRQILGTRFGWMACVCLYGLLQPLAAAATASPNISGVWSGSGSGSSYSSSENNTSPQSTSRPVQPAKGAVAATLVQTGNDLAATLQITPSSGEVFSINLAGKAGNFVLWARGQYQRSDGVVEQAFMSGHFAAKGDKIVGNMIIGGSEDLTFISYKLSKTSGPAAANARQGVFFPGAGAARASSDPPFNVAGKAAGRIYTFASNDKGAKYSAAVAGTIVPADQTAAFTFTGTETETFNTVQGSMDYASVFFGPGGSDTLVAFLKTSTSAGTGKGWIFSDTQLIEFVISAKRQ